MSTRAVDRVDTWDERQFSGGYSALHGLADEEFSGVVRAGGAELYMTRGVVVGIRMGDIGDFEDTSGTAYEAPTDALPLLAIMQENSDEVRAKYYTEETSISKVDQTLSDGGFTGFIELSENVLSGDYYLVYHAGKSMAVAFVGESSRLIDGDEAFETADGEVGIYKVRPVDIEPIEIPEPTGGAAAGAADGDAGTADEPEPDDTDDEPATGGAGAAAASSAAAGASDPAQPAGGTTEGPASAGTAEQEAARETTAAADQSEAGEAAEESAAAESTAQTESQSSTEQAASRQDRGRASQEQSRDQRDRTTQRSQRSETREGAQQESARQRDQESSRGRESAASERASRSDAGQSREPSARTTRQENGQDRRATGAAASQSTDQTANAGASQRGQAGASAGAGRQQQKAQAGGAATGQDLETRAVPSLDPDRTAIPEQDTQPAPPTPNGAGGTASQQPVPEPEPQPDSEPDPQETTEPAQANEAPAREEPEPADQQPAPQQRPQTEAAPDDLVAELEEKEAEIERLESELARADEEREELRRQLDDLEAERDDLARELDDVVAERDGLAQEVEQLESELRRLEEEFGAATDAERRLTPAEALSGTDIFVRYHSKGKATLEKAHGASTRREDVNDNLRLEKHTQFDSASASVGGQTYAEFLEDTLEYQFVEWAIRDLLFEIRDTGHEKALQDLYDVLPQVDRAELSGVIRVTYTEDGQETQAEETFDIVLRDRMGNPLLVANLNDTREATTESMMEGLITSAERVGQSSDTFAGAFYVTESFFDPTALEIADEATKGGLLSRDKRKSFVNLSRKNGYHLCLVEARNENFHLAVPEL